MSFLIGLLMVILFQVCVLLTVVILFQDNKAGGLAGALGGGAADSPFGARGGERLTRWTLYLGVAFFVLVIALGVATKFKETPAVGRDAPAADHAPAR